jgi:hypothetical protein
MKRVESIEELIELAQQKKSVLMAEPQGVPVPAAFVINMQLIKVYHLHKQGIYIYEPKKK